MCETCKKFSILDRGADEMLQGIIDICNRGGFGEVVLKIHKSTIVEVHVFYTARTLEKAPVKTGASLNVSDLSEGGDLSTKKRS
jgi:hypothetical protein